MSSCVSDTLPFTRHTPSTHTAPAIGAPPTHCAGLDVEGGGGVVAIGTVSMIDAGGGVVALGGGNEVAAGGDVLVGLVVGGLVVGVGTIMVVTTLLIVAELVESTDRLEGRYSCVRCRVPCAGVSL